MAFKIEDRPWSSENKRKRKNRAENIVKEKIPSNEYQVNRSGKLACLVCPRWPVFDTFPMLANHRESSRHQTNKKTWDDLVMDKEFAEQKKTQKMHVRQQLLDAGKQTAPLITRTKDVVNQILEGGGNESMDDVSKQGNTSYVVGRKDDSTSTRHSLSNTSETDADVSSGWKSSNFSTKSHAPTRDCTSATSQKSEASLPLETQSVKTEKVCSVMTKEEYNSIAQRKHELKLIQAGWIKDSSGKWMKDENCEFDSDEETPS